MSSSSFLREDGTPSSLVRAAIVLRRRERAHESAETGRIDVSQAGAIHDETHLPLLEEVAHGLLEESFRVPDDEVAQKRDERDTSVLEESEFHGVAGGRMSEGRREIQRALLRE